MTNYDVVKKLTGSIEPVGETHTDDIRFEHLKEHIKLVDSLVDDLLCLLDFKKCFEHSRKRAGKYAEKHLYEIKDYIEANLGDK